MSHARNMPPTPFKQPPSDYDIAVAINRMKFMAHPFIQHRDQELFHYLADEAHRGRLDQPLLDMVVTVFITDHRIYPNRSTIQRLLQDFRPGRTTRPVVKSPSRRGGLRHSKRWLRR